VFLASTPNWIGDYTTIFGFIITAITLCGLVFRFFFTPHLQKIIYKETQELKEIIDSMHLVIHKELTHNGGGSIKDQIAELKKDIAILKDRDEREKS
jgi:hypothetical protein